IPGFGAGIDGEYRVVVGRASSFQLGRHVMMGPVVGLSMAAAGHHSTSESDGCISSDILQRFLVVFDYSRNQMILEASARISDPFEADCTGMVLAASGPDRKTILVRRVQPESVAAEVGIKEGDEIISVDGQSSSQLSLSEVGCILARPGRRVAIEIKRAGSVERVDFNLVRRI